jgi:hypothetical protein
LCKNVVVIALIPVSVFGDSPLRVAGGKKSKVLLRDNAHSAAMIVERIAGKRALPPEAVREVVNGATAYRSSLRNWLRL